MPAVGLAVKAAAVVFAKSAVGSFLTTTLFGRLLTSVAFSALQSVLSRKKNKSTPQTSGIRTTTTQTGGANAASFILGAYATEGVFVCPPMTHNASGGSPGNYLTYVIEVSDVPGCSLANYVIIDGEAAPIGGPLHPDYGTPIGGVWGGHAWIKFYDGRQTSADLMLQQKYGGNAVRPWFADMVGRGICYAILTFLANPEIANAFPKVRLVINGQPLYDPRFDSSVGGVGAQRFDDPATWAISQNPAVQIYNILRGINFGSNYVWGGGAEADDLPLDNWWAAINRADAQIALAGGGTETQLRAALEVFADDQPAEITEEILSAVGGELVESGGTWKIRLGGPALPVYFFTDDDVVATEAEEFAPFSVAREAFNGVRAVYPDPGTLWEPRDAPARYDEGFAITDPAQRRVADLNLIACPFPMQVQRVMRAYLEEEARALRHTLTLPQDALVLEPLDVVSWASESNGYTAKAFEIDTMTDPLVAGLPRLVLKERNPEDDAWIPDYELPYVASETGVQTIPPEEVAGFAAVPSAIPDQNGVSARPAIKVSWDAPSADVRGLSFEVEAANGSSIVKIATINVAAGEYVITEGILPQKDYRVRARLVVDRPTVWTDYVYLTSPNLRTRVEDVDSISFQVSGLSVFGGSLRSSNFVSGSVGWQITQSGNAEFNNLIARSSLRVGAVSDLTEQYVFAEAYVPPNTSHTVFTFGPALGAEFVHLQFYFEVRSSGIDNFIRFEQGNSVEDQRNASSRFILQLRHVNGGVTTPWVVLSDTGQVTGGWTAFGNVIHLVGPYDATQVQLLTSDFAIRPDIPQPNVRGVVFRSQRVAR